MKRLIVLSALAMSACLPMAFAQDEDSNATTDSQSNDVQSNDGLMNDVDDTVDAQQVGGGGGELDQLRQLSKQLQDVATHAKQTSPDPRALQRELDSNHRSTGSTSTGRTGTGSTGTGSTEPSWMWNR